MLSLTLAEIVQASRGLLVIGDPKTAVRASGISTDSRSLKRGDLFFAIKGDRFDGHRFLNECIKKGAAACVVSQVPPNLVISAADFSAIIKVPDTRKALAASAKLYRQKFGSGVRKVAISGSCGKTTVKEMTAQILAGAGPTVYSQGNMNNEIGCPLSVFSMDGSHKYGVFEIGASAVGEVKRLAEIVEPDTAVVTNIRLEHTETFGSLEKIAEGESEILLALSHNGWAVLPFDDPFFDFLKSRIPQERGIRIKSFGFSKKASVHVTGITSWPEEPRATLVHQEDNEILDQFDFTLPVLGRFNLLNAAAAAAACFSLGVGADKVRAGLARFVPPPMRFQLIRLKNDITFVNDSYNANPGSVRSALEGFIESFSNRNLCVVLADMLELGEISRSEHQQLGKFLAGFPLSRVILFGPQSKFTYEGAKSFFINENVMTHCADRPGLLKAVKESLKPGTAVLFKGSRGMRLEEVIEKLVEDQGP